MSKSDGFMEELEELCWVKKNKVLEREEIVFGIMNIIRNYGFQTENYGFVFLLSKSTGF